MEWDVPPRLARASRYWWRWVGGMFLNAQKTPNTVTSRDLRMQRSGCYPKFSSLLEGEGQQAGTGGAS